MTHSAHAPSRTRFLSALGAVGALVFLLLWMEGAFTRKVAPGLSEPEAAEAPQDRASARVERRIAEDVFAWPGTVAARSGAEVAAKLPGRILEIGVRAGDRVRKGQVLARLDDAEIKARVGQARAGLAAADAQAGRAGADARRLQNLYEKEAATRQTLDAALAASRASAAEARAARDALREAESRLADTVLRAPFDGVVVRRRLEPGDMALPGSAVLSLQESRQLRLESAVPAACAGRVALGQELRVRIANPPLELPAVVDEIQPAADPATRTVLVKARLPEGTAVQPGAFGWLQQSCGETEVLLVPATAVSRIGQLESVRLLVDGRVRLRHVRTGKRHDGQVTILSGLEEGDTVLLPETRP